MTSPEKNSDELRLKLNRETSRMPWVELQPHFASGIVIGISNDLDLIEVAVRIANDDKESIAGWISEKRIGQVADKQAATWLEENTTLWAVVVKPWLLVQPEKSR